MRCPLQKQTIYFFYLFEMGSLYPSKSNKVPYLENAAVKWFHMRCAYRMRHVVYEQTIHFFYLLEMGSLYPSNSNNVPYLENPAVKWFHMRCVYCMGRPI